MARPDRPRRDARFVLLLAAIALVVPVVETIGWLVALAAFGPAGVMETVQMRLCRPGRCGGQDPSGPGPLVEVATISGVIAGPWLVAPIGFGIALLSRRRGWASIPMTLVHILFVLTLWNGLVITLSGGDQWIAALPLLLAAFGPVLAMVGLGQLAVSARRRGVDSLAGPAGPPAGQTASAAPAGPRVVAPAPSAPLPPPAPGSQVPGPPSAGQPWRPVNAPRPPHQP